MSPDEYIESLTQDLITRPHFTGQGETLKIILAAFHSPSLIRTLSFASPSVRSQFQITLHANLSKFSSADAKNLHELLLDERRGSNSEQIARAELQLASLNSDSLEDDIKYLQELKKKKTETYDEYFIRTSKIGDPIIEAASVIINYNNISPECIGTIAKENRPLARFLDSVAMAMSERLITLVKTDSNESSVVLDANRDKNLILAQRFYSKNDTESN